MIDKWTLNYFDYWHLLEEGFLSCVLKISIDSSNWAIRSNWPKKSRLIQRTSSEFLLLYPLGEDSRLEEVWGAVKGGIIRNEIALNQRVIQSTAIYRSAGSKLWRNWNRRRPRCSAHDNSELGLWREKPTRARQSNFDFLWRDSGMQKGRNRGKGFFLNYISARIEE